MFWTAVDCRLFMMGSFYHTIGIWTVVWFIAAQGGRVISWERDTSARLQWASLSSNLQDVLSRSGMVRLRSRITVEWLSSPLSGVFMTP